MNIGVLHVSTAHTWRGGEQQLYYLLEEQQKSKSIQPFLICAADSEIESKVKQLENVQLYTFPKRSSLSFGFAKMIKKITEEQDIDLVHMHDSHAHTFAVLSRWFFGMRKPMVLHRRVDYAVSNHIFSKKKYNSKGIKAYICVSNFVAKVLIPSIQAPSKVHVIHSGIDFKKLDRISSKNIREWLDLPKESTIIAHIGALEQQKDYFTFIEAADLILKALSDSEYIYFVGFGEGSQRQELETLIKQKGLEDRILLPGFMEDIHAYMQSIDMIMFSSQEEGLGTSLIDCMYYQIPIASTNAGGIPELITDEENGLLAEVKNAVELKTKVIRLLQSKDLQNKFKSSGKNKALKLSKAKVAKKISEIYQRIISSMA